MHIRFRSPAELEEFIAELLQLKLIELTKDKKQRAECAAALETQLLIADDGHTYPLYKIKTLNDLQAAPFSNLTFSTKTGKKLKLNEVRQANDQELRSLIHNKPLAEMICSANPRMHFLGMTIPNSAITPFSLLYPISVPTEHAVEYSVIQETVLKFKKNPLSNKALSFEELQPNIALSDLLLLNYNYFIDLKAKTNNKNIDKSKVEILDDIIENLDHSLALQKTAFPGIKCKELLAQNSVLLNKEELAALEIKIRKAQNKLRMAAPAVLILSALATGLLIRYSYDTSLSLISSQIGNPYIRIAFSLTSFIITLGFLYPFFKNYDYYLRLLTENFIEPLNNAALKLLIDHNELTRLNQLKSDSLITQFYSLNKDFFETAYDKLVVLEKRLMQLKNPAPVAKIEEIEKPISLLQPPTASLINHRVSSPFPRLKLVPSPSTKREEEDFLPTPSSP